MDLITRKSLSPFVTGLRSCLRNIAPVLLFSLIVLHTALPATALCAPQADNQSTTAASEKPASGSNSFTTPMQDFFRNVCRYFTTKYRWGGQNPSGFDCSGFVRFMYDKAFNMQLPRSAREMAAIGSKVQRQELKPGDLVFFCTKGSAINHVGIFIGADTFIHSSLSKGITEDQLRENYYDKRFAGAVRLLDSRENQTIPSGLRSRNSIEKGERS
jgi:cell wall-associated NlpC family hydrolase